MARIEAHEPREARVAREAQAAHVAQLTWHRVPARSTVDSGFPCENNILEAQVGPTPGPAPEVDRILDMEAVALEKLTDGNLF